MVEEVIASTRTSRTPVFLSNAISFPCIAAPPPGPSHHSKHALRRAQCDSLQPADTFSAIIRCWTRREDAGVQDGGGSWASGIPKGSLYRRQGPIAAPSHSQTTRR